MRSTIQISSVALALGLLAGAVPPADAQGLQDTTFQALAEARRFPELEQAATTRLAAHPDDGDAWLAYTQSLLGQNDAGIAARREAALARLGACTEKTPRIAACHYGVGALAGVQLLSQGLMKAAFGVGRVRDELQLALEIDPQLYPARSGLVQFYLLVPGIAGGSVSKAREVAQGAVLRQPEYAKLLNAGILQYEDKLADAEHLLSTVQAGADAELADELRGSWIGVGFGWLSNKQPARAREIFERIAKDKPELPEAHYGLGRLLADQQQWDSAIAELKLAATLPGHDMLPVDYRLGIAWQGKGDAAQARAAFARYLASANPNPNNADDARKRLAKLG